MRAWVKQADVDDGRRDGLTTAESATSWHGCVRRTGCSAEERHPQASDGFLREGDPVNVFPFIEAEKAEQRNVVKACELLEVSGPPFTSGTSTFPRHVRSRMPNSAIASRTSMTVRARMAGLVCIRRYETRAYTSAGNTSRGSCAIRAWWAGAGDGGSRPPSPIPTSVAVDLLKRSFGPDTVELDRVYVGDITYIRTWEGWLYLATVIDLASRRVVGWAMADHMRAELVCDALTYGHREPSARARCDVPLRPRHPIHEQGVHRPARRPRDDPVAVASAAVLGQRRRGELLRVTQARVHLQTSTPTRAPARRAVFDYIEVFFNRRRLHSSLGYMTPAAYENKIRNHNAAHTA